MSSPRHLQTAPPSSNPRKASSPKTTQPATSTPPTQPSKDKHKDKDERISPFIRLGIMSTFLVPLLMAYGIRTYLAPNSGGVTAWDLSWTNNLPSSAQFLDQRTFNVLNTVQPPSERNGSNVCSVLLRLPFYQGLLTFVYSSSYLLTLPPNLSSTVHSTYTIPPFSPSSVPTPL